MSSRSSRGSQGPLEGFRHAGSRETDFPSLHRDTRRLRITTNVAALNTPRSLSGSERVLSRSLERLSSGLRSNRAADDAAGLSISEVLRSQVRGALQAARNIRDGLSMLGVADGATPPPPRPPTPVSSPPRASTSSTPPSPSPHGGDAGRRRRDPGPGERERRDAGGRRGGTDGPRWGDRPPRGRPQPPRRRREPPAPCPGQGQPAGPADAECLLAPPRHRHGPGDEHADPAADPLRQQIRCGSGTAMLREAEFQARTVLSLLSG